MERFERGHLIVLGFRLRFPSAALQQLIVASHFLFVLFTTQEANFTRPLLTALFDTVSLFSVVWCVFVIPSLFCFRRRDDSYQKYYLGRCVILFLINGDSVKLVLSQPN